MESITGWLGSSVRWYWIVVLCSLMTTGFVIPAFLAFSFSQTETEGQFSVGSKVIHAKFQSVEILNVSSSSYSSDPPPVFKVSVFRSSVYQLSMYHLYRAGLLTARRHSVWLGSWDLEGAQSQHVFPGYHASLLDQRLLKINKMH